MIISDATINAVAEHMVTMDDTDDVSLYRADARLALEKATQHSGETEWKGYGTPANGEQWRLAAEWITCSTLHGNDDLFDKMKSIGVDEGQAILFAIFIADGLKAAADRIEHGRVEEACCYEEQRSNWEYVSKSYDLDGSNTIGQKADQVVHVTIKHNDERCVYGHSTD